MGKTVFNPVTTKWRGAIGGFRYSILRGKQIIAERASAMKNPRTPAQMENRTKFKLASQFSALWSDILALNLVKKESDATMARSIGTSAAYEVAEMANNAASLELVDFTAEFNSRTNQPVEAGISLVWTATTQSITAPADEVITYKVVAFDENDNPMGQNVVTYVSDGTAKMVDLPAIFGNASRYDIMVFGATPKTGAEGFTGSISNIEGPIDTAELYHLYAAVAADQSVDINGLLSGSYLVA